MSKPVKNLITESYKRRFADVDGAVVVNLQGMESNQSNELRAALGAKGIKLTMIKNTLARKAIEDTAMDGVGEMLEGPCAFVFGGESVVHVARELVAIAKTYDKMAFKGAVMDRTLFGAGEVEALSKYPTREEAIGKLVGAALGPAGAIANILKNPGNIGGIVKALEERAKDGGQAA